MRAKIKGSYDDWIVFYAGHFIFSARSNAFSLDFNNRNTIRQPRPLNITTNDVQQNHQPQRGALRLSFDPDGQPRPVPVVRAQPPPLQDRTR